jgi:hypothetical protein
VKGDRIPIAFVGNQTVYEGQSVLYEQCVNPGCPAHRDGFHHAHAKIEDDPVPTEEAS